MITARVRIITIAICLLITVSGRSAAQQQNQPLLPDTAAERIVAFYNRDVTTRFTGDTRVAAGTALRGDVAALGGTLIIDGTVDGSVVVINGNLMVGAAGHITGDVSVAGGDVTITPGGVIAGAVATYRSPLRYRQDGTRLIHVADSGEPVVAAGVDFAFGRTDLLVAAHGAYNRIEGMPIAIGPRVRFAGSHPTSARALLIARSAHADEINPKRFGYDIQVDQLIVPAFGVTLGARLFSEITPVEIQGLTDREAALAAFLLHRDYRDHYEREGWSLFAQMQRPGSAYTLDIEYRDEEHLSVAPADPLTVLNNRETWRAEPGIAEGALHSLAARLRYDTRNEPRDPSAGWLIGVQLEQGLGGSIANPAMTDPRNADESRAARSGYLTTSIDVRRYARLSPYARIGIRVYGAGSLDARPLPPQRQHTLGGVGSLPAYAAFAFDCGARRSTVLLRGEPFYPYYGCDRVALVQLEYQAGFPFARRLARSAGIGASIAQLARWVAYFDAGRAWNESGAADGRLGGDDDFSADAGLGLRFGPLGAYWTVPLSGRGQAMKVFVRLDPRL